MIANTDQVEDKASKPNQSIKRPTKHQHANGSIAILRDSMPRPLNPSKLCRSTGKKVILKTFPGATAAHMNHYVKPAVKKNPDLVTRCGTNDTQYKEPEEIVKEIDALSTL